MIVAPMVVEARAIREETAKERGHDGTGGDATTATATGTGGSGGQGGTLGDGTNGGFKALPTDVAW
jgi:hypothetical protein